MSLETIIKDLETKIAQVGNQLEQSSANLNFMAGVKTEAERILGILKQGNTEQIVNESTQGVNDGN